MPEPSADDIQDSLNYLSGMCHGIAKANGWYENQRNAPELLALIHSEVSECLEAYRDGDQMSGKVKGYRETTVELADVIIRVLDMAAFYGMDIGGAVMAKVRYNQTRPHRHGGKVY